MGRRTMDEGNDVPKMFSDLLSAMLLASRALATNSRYQAIPRLAKTFISLIKMEINLNRKLGVLYVLQNAFPPWNFWSLHAQFIDFLLFRHRLLFAHSIWPIKLCDRQESVAFFDEGMSFANSNGNLRKQTNCWFISVGFCAATYPSAYFHYLRHESAAT